MVMLPPRNSYRLFDLIQILRDGRLHTARALAERLEVSTRTIWRDMAVLSARGFPIEGERGLGYMLRESIDLPPLTLTADEAEALRLGLALVARGADPSLSGASASLLAKIGPLAPPEGHQGPMEELYIHPGAEALAAARHLPALRRAIRLAEVLLIDYADQDGRETRRAIRPLMLEFWGKVWTLAAWCEDRADFRSFRVDRIAALVRTGRVQPAEPGRDRAAWAARKAAKDWPV